MPKSLLIKVDQLKHVAVNMTSQLCKLEPKSDKIGKPQKIISLGKP